MDFDITSALDNGVLIVTFTGRSTEKNAQAMTKRYLDIVLGSGMNKVLADIRLLDARLSDAETYFLVRDLPDKPTPMDIKTAVLESEERRDYANFLETTAANAGVRFKCFVDREEALSWLRAPGALISWSMIDCHTDPHPRRKQAPRVGLHQDSGLQ